MPFRPNYNQQRNERNRAKEAKKQEKLQRREEEAAKRKAARAAGVEYVEDDGAATEVDVADGPGPDGDDAAAAPSRDA